jgi:hypothetical protein
MAEWDKTIKMKSRLSLEGKLDRINNEDYYQNRHIIHRDSKIDGGVYLGQNQREAIVVDSKKYPALRKLYEKAKNKAMRNGVIEKDKILQAVYETVAEAMPKQDDSAVEEIIHRYGVEKDGKISLDVFLLEDVGVCRHDALACAALLELFKEDGIIRGKPSVDRNSTSLGGHAWCRYTNSAGEVFILDVAQGYLGKLEKAQDKNRWVYQRPEDF